MAVDRSNVASEVALQCLQLHLVQGVGPYRFGKLVEHFGSVEDVMRASRRELEQVSRVGRKTSEAIIERHDNTFFEEELKRARKLGVRVICQADEEYPSLLKEIPDAPICLYVKGMLSHKDRSAVAIVGSRSCSHYGSEQAYQFGMAIARTGMTVVSGLARGVDAQSHLGALDCRGRTIAVLGSGLAHMKHHENVKLAERIVESGGAVISELPLEQPPNAQNFPSRNRIIAGLALGTLVVEAAWRSGALITARLAGEYNREVFAVPGRVDNNYSAGTNHLIKTVQAKLTTGIADILEELGHANKVIRENYEQLTLETIAQAAPEMSDDERMIFESLSVEGVGLEAVCDRTALPPERISSALTTLQLKGVVEQLPGNRFARIRA